MALKVCEKCGEEYSDSYKTCPFCAEDEEYATHGHPARTGHRIAKRKSPSILGPALILVLLALVALLLYFFLGSGLRDIFHRGEKEPVVVTVSQSVLDLEAGATGRLTASGAETYTWSSSDPAVATVSADGLVTAVAGGSTTVSVTAEGAEKPAECLVTVTEPVAVEVTLDQASMNLTVGEARQLTASGAESYVWSSNNTSVATVGGDGTVSAVSAGSAVIVAKDANSDAAASCIVTVEPRQEDPTVDISKLKFKVGKYELGAGQSVSYPFDKNADGGKGAFPAAKVSLTGTTQSVKWSVKDANAVLTENSDGSVSVQYKGTKGAVVVLTAEVGGQKVTLNLNFSK